MIIYPKKPLKLVAKPKLRRQLYEKVLKTHQKTHRQSDQPQQVNWKA